MSEYSLNKYERETIILWNEAESEAEIYTCSEITMRRMDKLMQKTNAITMVGSDRYSKTYKIPKKLVGVRAPRQYSEEQKRELNLRMELGRKKKEEAENG